MDSFKAYNDTHGHQAGDQVLREVAATLDAHVRAADTVYRFGGEEFLVVLPQQTLREATVAAERARNAVEALAIRHPHTGGPITISVGVAECTPGDATPKDVLALADASLYQAKLAGRNRVVSAGLP